MKYIKRVIPFAAVLFILASCATQTAYYNTLNSLVSAERLNEAADYAEKSKESEYGDKNILQYCLDRGFLLHISGQYDESNRYFEKAKKLSEEYFTKSVTTEAGTLLVSDNVRPYYGEDFERALVNVFSALNYALLNKENDALVEARQVDQFLKTLQTNYGHKNVYKEDAFARYLMGMLYENQGQLNDAYISYYNALDAYSNSVKYYKFTAPLELVSDCVRLGTKLGFDDDVKQVKTKWSYSERAIPKDCGELVVLDYNGYAPEKVNTFFEIALGKAWVHVEAYKAQGEDAEKMSDARSTVHALLADDIVRVAFPKYEDLSYNIKSFEAKSADVKDAARSSTVEDIGGIAKQNLDDRITRVRIKAIVRATLKFVLAKKISEKVGDNNGPIAGWLAKKALNVAASTTEKADVRSWRSLPDRILMSRLILPKGKHSVQVVFYDQSGVQVKSQMLENVEINPGKKTFVKIRTAA